MQRVLFAGFHALSSHVVMHDTFFSRVQPQLNIPRKKLRLTDGYIRQLASGAKKAFLVRVTALCGLDLLAVAVSGCDLFHQLIAKPPTLSVRFSTRV